jgi:hypothetical protein
LLLVYAKAVDFVIVFANFSSKKIGFAEIRVTLPKSYANVVAKPISLKFTRLQYPTGSCNFTQHHYYVKSG